MKPNIMIKLHHFPENRPLNSEEEVFSSHILYAMVQLSKMEVDTSIIAKAFCIEEYDVKELIRLSLEKS